MNIFDSDSADGLSAAGSIGLVFALGFGAYVLWQIAYQRGAKDVFRFDNIECVVTATGGRTLTRGELQQRGKIIIPKGATVTSACLSPA